MVLVVLGLPFVDVFYIQAIESNFVVWGSWVGAPLAWSTYENSFPPRFRSS